MTRALKIFFLTRSERIRRGVKIMQKLKKQLESIKRSKGPGLMMHIVAGFPDLDSSEKIARQIFDSGADLLEIQIPFSDPVADGPIIASANEISLKNGTTVEACLDMIQRITSSTEKSVLIMTYFNIVHHFGVEKFCATAQKIGVQGLIVPDYPFDEDGGNFLLQQCQEHQLALIQVIASTSRIERIAQIVEHASGFVYCMARTGITGKKTEISDGTISYLQTVKSNCELPIAVGFGLSERSQVEALEPYADIMVVGSALIQIYADKPLEMGLKKVKDFIGVLTGRQ